MAVLILQEGGNCHFGDCRRGAETRHDAQGRQRFQYAVRHGQMQLIDTLSFCKYETRYAVVCLSAVPAAFSFNPMLLMTNCGPALTELHGTNGIPSKLTAKIIAVVISICLLTLLAYVYAPSWGKDRHYSKDTQNR